MSDTKQLQPWIAAIQEAEPKFLTMSDPETYAKESLFAYQAVMKNEYLMRIANQSPMSLRLAVTNIAAIGLTLNPALGYAYLVPRDNVAVLDISYKGLIKIATDTGAVRWAQAENVYSNDNFVYHGPTTSPEHSYDPFSKDRGEYQGSYCVARTADGDTLSEVMPASEIYEIRDKSEMYKRSGKGPWKDFFGEMAKKTVIKRASKTWPKSTKSNRLEKAINLLNETGEGIQFEHDTIQVKESYTIDQKETFERLLSNNDSLGLLLFSKSIPKSAWIDLYNTGEKGQKVKLKERVKALEAEGREILEAIEDAIDRMDYGGVAENMDGCDGILAHTLPAILSEERAILFREMLLETKE